MKKLTTLFYIQTKQHINAFFKKRFTQDRITKLKKNSRKWAGRLATI